mmetsp:Transcript_7942/g.19706  ORF Transcript_7942/g.19706 Transcript_7942/m.19706 type:complete len:239 (+) Transcript_7942:455-1171(+)
MKHANPSHSTRREVTTCLSSVVRSLPPAPTAARCEPPYSSPVFRSCARDSDIAASVLCPFSSSSAIIARVRRSPAVASCARDTVLASFAGGVAFSPSRLAPPRPSSARASSSRSCATRFAASVASRRICRSASREAARSAKAWSVNSRSAGRGCSSAMASSSCSSRRRRDMPVRATVAGSFARSATVMLPLDFRPPKANVPPVAAPDPIRSTAASTSCSTARIMRTCSAASSGSGGMV